jgi:pyruvate formate lyase activating enzyme
MKIHGLNKTTLLDYPGHVAATIFTGSCNFRCPFCHNGDLVLNPSSQPLIEEEEIFSFLKKRKAILSGVCITGGEPTLQEDLPSFIQKVKALGYLVKLDTNGYRPEMLKHLLNENLLDMVSMDIKSCPSEYGNAAGVPSLDISKINQSIALLFNCDIHYEFRTTVVAELHSEDTFVSIAEWIKGAKAYSLQCYKDSDSVLKKGYHAPSKKELNQYLKIVKKKIPNSKLRGVE